jgi:hypothetical protein
MSLDVAFEIRICTTNTVLVFKAGKSLFLPSPAVSDFFRKIQITDAESTGLDVVVKSAL